MLYCVCIQEDLQQLRFACSLFCKRAREWNGWGWLASAWPHGTSWPAVILLRDVCVSGSSFVLPSCGFGVLYGRSRKSKIAWGRMWEICLVLEIEDKGRRAYIREGKRRRDHTHLKKPVNCSNRDLNVTRPLLTEVTTAFCELDVPGHPCHLLQRWPSILLQENTPCVFFIPAFQALLQFFDKVFSKLWSEKGFLVMWCWLLMLSHHQLALQKAFFKGGGSCWYFFTDRQPAQLMQNCTQQWVSQELAQRRGRPWCC